MSWLQQNWVMVSVMIVVLGFVLKDHILAPIVGVEHMDVSTLAERLRADAGLVLIDVRTPGEFQQGHVKGAVLIPVSTLKSSTEKIAKDYADREIAVICRSGNRSLSGTVALKRAGITKVFNVRGGMSAWSGQGLPVAPGDN